MVATIYVGSTRCMGPVSGGASASNVLFQSGFQSATTLSAMQTAGATSCWKTWSGTDASTSQLWPPNIWGGGGRGQHIADTNVNTTTILNYIDHTLVTDTGHGGVSTQMMYQILKIPSPGSALQTVGILLEPTGSPQTDMYISMWLKFNLGFAADMGPNAWRSFFAWKTGGDYRVEAYVYTDGASVPYWFFQGDNNANGGLPADHFWDNSNNVVPVPDGTWFQFEIAWHRSLSDGWILAKVNGSTLFTRNTSLIGQNGNYINRIMCSLVYGDVTKSSYYPMEQWCDDIVIRDGLP